jgi:phospholipase C
MMENHTYDSLFGRYPLDPSGGVATLPQAADPFPGDNDHTGGRLIAALDSGRLDEFVQAGLVQYSAADVPTYWSYAQNFGLGDNFFSSMATLSQPNHLAMIAGQTAGEDDNGGNCTTTANSLSLNRAASTGVASFSVPCYTITSLPQVLSQNQISWRYYSNGGIWDAPKNVTALVTSPSNVQNPNQFLTDVQQGTMATVSWVMPTFANSDHPPSSIKAGQNFVSRDVSALMQSPYWNNTVIFVTWDDWGGFYDHVNPQALDADGLGLRAPLLVISPYAKPGYISHNLGEFASFLKFIEYNWGLPNLGQRDSLPMLSNLTDFFDFTQTPLAPVIEPKLPVSFVLQPSASAVDGGAHLPLDQVFGNSQTLFTYSVIDNDPDVPSVANVLIDSVPYTMTRGTTVNGGTSYQYSTTLAPGSHSYTFAFTDAEGSWAIPNNSTTYPGPVVGNVALDNWSANPGISTPGQPITFSVRYTSTTNTAPTQAQLQLDGITYFMTPSGPLNYSAGVTYSYVTSSLSVGVHFFRFLFDDGAGPWVLEGSDTPVISPITITGDGVSPATGTASTSFTFSATYTSADGTDPTNGALVYIDNVSHPMTYMSGTNSAGAVYQYATTLSTGTHTYFFYFANATNFWANPRYPSLLSLTVTAGSANAGPSTATKTFGHTIVAPSHSEDPDQSWNPIVATTDTPQGPNQPPTDDGD